MARNKAKRPVNVLQTRLREMKAENVIIEGEGVSVLRETHLGSNLSPRCRGHCAGQSSDATVLLIMRLCAKDEDKATAQVTDQSRECSSHQCLISSCLDDH